MCGGVEEVKERRTCTGVKPFELGSKERDGGRAENGVPRVDRTPPRFFL